MEAKQQQPEAAPEQLAETPAQPPAHQASSNMEAKQQPAQPEAPPKPQAEIPAQTEKPEAETPAQPPAHQASSNMEAKQQPAQPEAPPKPQAEIPAQTEKPEAEIPAQPPAHQASSNMEAKQQQPEAPPKPQAEIPAQTAVHQASSTMEAKQQSSQPDEAPEQQAETGEVMTISQDAINAFFDRVKTCGSKAPLDRMPSVPQVCQRDTCPENVTKLFDENRYRGKQARLDRMIDGRLPGTSYNCQSHVDRMFRGDANCEQRPPGNHTDDPEADADEELCMVVRLQEHLLNKVLSPPLDTEKTLLMNWKLKKGVHRVYLVGVGSGGMIAAEATLQQVVPIQDFATLRSHPDFRCAHPDLQRAWRARIVQSGKPVFAWTLTNLVVPEMSFQVPLGLRGKSFSVAKSSLRSYKHVELPEMRLKETAKYFMAKLSAEDYSQLRETALNLDGSIIQTGSTCSGTDISWSILLHTFSAINEEFSATGLVCYYFLSAI